MAQSSGQHFVSVRFGNVLGSRGSVLTTFAEQAASRGPMTVTDPEVTRYFMVIPEACELVIQAVAVGRSAETLVLEMGEPVRIVDVAKQILQMSGQTGVEIVFTGLRQGEKLHEDLFGNDEVVRPTAHEMVRAVTVPPLGIHEIPVAADWSAVLGGSR
jgi:FlaA1/EpsC-like NDP-sugar epimerase